MPRKKKSTTRSWLDPYPKSKDSERHVCGYHNIGYDERVSFRALDVMSQQCDERAIDRVLAKMEAVELEAQTLNKLESLPVKSETDKPSLWSRIKTCLTKK